MKLHYLFIILSLPLTVSCGGKQQPKIVRPVKTITIGSADLAGKTFPGYAAAVEYSELSFRVPGLLQELNVNEGQDVTKGQTIAKLDQRDFLLRINAEKATYQQSASQLERYKNLYSRGAISKQEYEQAQATYENAKSAYDKVLNDMNDTKLVVPFDGNIEKKHVENHQEVMAGQSVVRLINPRNLEFHFTLPEINVQYATLKVRYSIEMEVNKGTFYNAKLKDMVRASSGGSGIPVILTIDDPAFNKIKILPGYACNVKLELAGHTDTTMTVPLSSIYFDTKTGEASVWKIHLADSTVNLSPVKTGGLLGENDIVILSGLTVGDRIVSAGVTMLHEGDKVKINNEF